MSEPTIKDVMARVEGLERLLTARIPGGGVVDPAPDPWGGWFPRPSPFPFPFPFPQPQPRPIPIPQPGDPSPIDLSRLTISQLELSREMLKTERARLDSMEKLIDEQISALR